MSEVDFEMEPDPKLNRTTNAIIGAAIQVHKTLGPGYQESVYCNALALEFRKRGIRFRREMVFPVLYDGVEVGQSRLDFLIDEAVILEVKAAETIHPIFVAQLISYLKATERKLAIIITFNVRKLTDGIRRISN